MRLFWAGALLSPPILALIFIVLLISGCAQYAAIEETTKAVTDKAMDKVYDTSCNMRYKTEVRFRARHQLTQSAIDTWCRRRPPE